MTDKFYSFADLLRGALADRLVPADDMAELFTDDIIFEFPFAPEGMPKRLDGRVALADHMARLGPLLTFGQMVLRDVHPSGNTMILEFSCSGRGTETGAPYDQDYVSVITLRDGRIARYRDYWNPLIVLSALGGAEAAMAAYQGAA